MTDEEALRRHFIGWQCRIRQARMRDHHGLPSTGMQPRVIDARGETVADAMTVLILPDPPDEKLAEFRYIARSVGDPSIRREKVVTVMSAAFFQNTTHFDDRLTALFPSGSEVAERLVAGQSCRLLFDQFNQKFDLLCDVQSLPSDSKHYQFTWWHNAFFNPHLAADVTVLGFRPQWKNSSAEPTAPAPGTPQ
jgi:hypothetical protein